MRSEATLQMVAIAKRIAVKNGVSVSEVLTRFSQSVKKSAHTRSDFFWDDSDISLCGKKNFRRVRSAVASVRRGKVSQFDKEMTK